MPRRDDKKRQLIRCRVVSVLQVFTWKYIVANCRRRESRGLHGLPVPRPLSERNVRVAHGWQGWERLGENPGLASQRLSPAPANRPAHIVLTMPQGVFAGSSSEWHSIWRAKKDGPRAMGSCRMRNGFLTGLIGRDRKPAKAGVHAMFVSLTYSHGHPEGGKSVALEIEKGDWLVRKCCACLTARLISVEMTTFLPACLRPAWTDPPNGIAQASTGLARLHPCKTVSPLSLTTSNRVFGDPPHGQLVA